MLEDSHPIPWKSNCGGFDNYRLLMTIKHFNDLGRRFAPRSHTSRTSLRLSAHMLDLAVDTADICRGREGVELSREAHKHRSRSVYSETCDAELRAQASRRHPESCLRWNISIVWTLLKMPTSLKENWVKCTECKLKSAKGEEMIVINISSIKLECGNYSSVFYIYRSAPRTFSGGATSLLLF